MPSPTYDLISEQTLGSAAATVTFSSIPGTYKDLVVEIVGTMTATANIGTQFNGDTGTNYSSTQLTGNGTTAASARASNDVSALFGNADAGQSTNYAYIMSYTNTNVYKTVLGRGSSAGYRVVARVGLWRSTAAITSITLVNDGSTTFATGNVIRLWGIA